MQISQAGNGAHPEVLVRFREIVGSGSITGPYRGYLYYWKTTRTDVIDEIAAALWPYLSADKRSQLEATAAAVGRHYSGPAIRARGTEAAWAAGLFDAEGSLWVAKDERCRPDWRGVAMELAQASAKGVPDALCRFNDIVGVGHISGPRTLRKHLVSTAAISMACQRSPQHERGHHRPLAMAFRVEAIADPCGGGARGPGTRDVATNRPDVVPVWSRECSVGIPGPPSA